MSIISDKGLMATITILGNYITDDNISLTSQRTINVPVAVTINYLNKKYTICHRWVMTDIRFILTHF